MVWEIGSVFIVLLVINYCEATVDCNARPPFQNIQKCCKKPEMTRNEQIEEECKDFKKGSEKGREHGRGHGGPCYAECILNSSKILVNGEFVAANVKPFVQSTISDVEFHDVVDQAFSKCASEVKTFMSENPAPPHPPNANGPKCDFYGGALMHCAFKESFINCPDKFADKSDECNNAREYMQNCKMPKPLRREPPSDAEA